MSKKPKKDHSAEIARADEAAKQARIAAGQGNIDKAFAGFDDSYFKKIGDDYTAAYNPQLEEQYGDTLKQATYKLAEQGNVGSSAAGDLYGKIAKKNADSQAQIGDLAQSAVNNLRTQVQQNKSNLYDQNRSAADPSSAASMAAAAAGNLQAPQVFSPLADAFAGLISSAGQTATIRAAANASGGGAALFNNFLGSNNGSSKVKY